jgi:ankyrin repeat protein
MNCDRSRLIIVHIIIMNRDFARVNSFAFSSGGTPLHRSSENGHLETCRLLLQFKADVMAADDK